VIPITPNYVRSLISRANPRKARKPIINLKPTAFCCKSCKYIVARGRIQAHLCSKPHGLVKKEIEKAKLWAEALDLINSNEEILALPPIPDDSMPIKALGEPKSRGFRCTFTTSCRAVSANARRRNEHLWKVHNVELV
jgi:hypothetical protein